MVTEKVVMNGSIKEDFKKTYEKESTRRLVDWLFGTASEFEQEFGKDLFDFNLNELEKYFLRSKKLSNNTLKTYLNFIAKYIDFAQKKYPHKVRRNTNIIREELDIDEFAKKVTKQKDKFLHVTEFKDLISDNDKEFIKRPLLNYTDKFLVYILFYGACGEDLEELRNLKYSDIDETNNTLFLKDKNDEDPDNPLERKLVIPSLGIELLQEAKKEHALFTYNEEENENKTMQLEGNSDYVFRRSINGQKTTIDRISAQGLMKRLRTAGEFVGKPLTPSKILKSGKLHGIKVMVLDNNKDFTFDNYKNIIGKRYHPYFSERSLYNQMNPIKKDLKELYPEIKDKL